MEGEVNLYHLTIDFNPDLQHSELIYAKNKSEALCKLYESESLKKKLNYPSTPENRKSVECHRRAVIYVITNINEV